MNKNLYNDNDNIKCKVCGAKIEGGYCDCSDNETRGIILRNINLTGIPPIEQARKVEEERKEFVYAFNEYKNHKSKVNKYNVIDELLDEFQAKLGLLEKEGIKAEEVQEYYSTWIKKLENRPRTKKCSKCIECQSIDGEQILCIETGKLIVDENIAKECRRYEE